MKSRDLLNQRKRPQGDVERRSMYKKEERVNMPVETKRVTQLRQAKGRIR